jgi:hypothetical protein
VEKHKKKVDNILMRTGDFHHEGALQSTNSQVESAAGVWYTGCSWWHSSHDSGSVLGFSIQESVELGWGEKNLSFLNPDPLVDSGLGIQE